MKNYTRKETTNGCTFYYNENDELHRTDGPAYVGSEGHKEWWLDGKHHRTDGPAVEWESGTKEWWVDGKLHRTDGPAIEFGCGFKEWWVDGFILTKEQFEARYTSKYTEKPQIEVIYETIKVPAYVVIEGVKYKLVKES